MMEQIHLLQAEIASSRNSEAQLREEIIELRTIISVLDAVVCHRAENTPTGEEDSAKKKKKKVRRNCRVASRTAISRPGNRATEVNLKRSPLMGKCCVGRCIPRRPEAGVLMGS
jgi:hypothetical protein